MRLLLDTHALIWWCTDDDRLSGAARAAIQDEGNEVFVSAASAWEIATKLRLGKLHGVPGLEGGFDRIVPDEGFRHLPVTHAHASRAGGYEHEHRDPFDRMLAAQAAIEHMVLITRDPAFAAFSVKILW